MGPTRKRIVKTMQNVGLVAKPTFRQVAASTVSDARNNATQAVGELGMDGLKASGRKISQGATRVRKSKAARDARVLAVRARAGTAPFVSLAVSAMIVEGLTRGLSAGLQRTIAGPSRATAPTARRTEPAAPRRRARKVA